jgi:hypothetical protein
VNRGDRIMVSDEEWMAEGVIVTYKDEVRLSMVVLSSVI